MMLHKICLFQVLVYLFIIPIIRSTIGDASWGYSYFPALFFLSSFVAGGSYFVVMKHKPKESRRFNNFSINPYGKLLIIGCSVAYISISINYGLFNRRIGTENAAELFSSIPLYILILFRVFEVILPFLLAAIISQIYIKDKSSSSNIISLLFLITVVIFSGAANSRSQTFFVLAIIIVLIQNLIEIEKLKKLLIISSFVAMLAIILVTILRLYLQDMNFDNNYIENEFLTRLDGLEVISKLIDMHGISAFGINLSSILSPIVSSIPFLPGANELKAAALTTVKANILVSEFGSSQGDINSFVILDAYYWGGMVGVLISGFSIGLLVKWVDRNIGSNSERVWQSLAVAIAGNVIYMEREYISILISIIRDWFIFYFFMIFFTRRNITNFKKSLGSDFKCVEL